jgi:hypothetical protein
MITNGEFKRDEEEEFVAYFKAPIPLFACRD